MRKLLSVALALFAPIALAGGRQGGSSSGGARGPSHGGAPAHSSGGWSGGTTQRAPAYVGPRSGPPVYRGPHARGPVIVGVPWYAGTPWAYYDDSNTLAYPQDNGVPAEIPPPPPEATADEQGGPQPYGVAPPGANGPVEGPPPNQPAPPSSSQQPSNEGRHESMGSRQDITEDSAPGAPVYHWVDEDGVDNYGTSVPPQYRSKAEKVGGQLSGIVWTVSPATK